MKNKLSTRFRKKNAADRLKEVQNVCRLTEIEFDSLSSTTYLSETADRFVESCVGTYPVPIGIAQGFLINDKECLIPMATEEPSVILAASYAASLIKRGGGFKAWSDPSIMTAQIFLSQFSEKVEEKVQRNLDAISHFVNNQIPGIVARGGGFRGVKSEVSKDGSLLCVSVDIDVKDAMGANVVNTVAESLKPLLKAITNGVVLMGVLTNSGLNRIAYASFSCSSALFKNGICDRIVDANRVANLFPERAITHNKGIMNGISALALVTGNDTRAIEAGAHFYASRNGQYQSLTNYHYDSNAKLLSGEIALPLTLGTVGGSIDKWPASLAALKILNVQSAHELAQIAAALGLAQNLAALMALVTDGIQQGHMKLHQRKRENR